MEDKLIMNGKKNRHENHRQDVTCHFKILLYNSLCDFIQTAFKDKVCIAFC